MGQDLSTEPKSSCYIFPKLDMDFVSLNYGEIFKIYEGSGRLRVEWQIPNFLSLRKEISDSFISPVFNFLQSECHLVVAPFNDTDPEKWYKIYVYWKSLEKPVTFTLGIKQVDGTIDRFSIFSDRAPEGCSVRGQDKFLKRYMLLQRHFMLLSSGALTVTLTVQATEASHLEGEAPVENDSEIECVWDSRKAKAKTPDVVSLLSDDSDNEDPKTSGSTFVSRDTQTEDLPIVDNEDSERERLEAKSISKLTTHLGNLLLESPDHDVTIKVKNHHFKAHKALLRARSPVFSSMFEHDMQEKSNDAISIDDCDPGTFGEFLRHIYTGKTEIDSVRSAVDLYYAGDKYDFEELKEACVLYLTESLEITTVCDVIKMATVHGEANLLQRALSFFAENMEQILQTVEWQHFLQDNVTVGNEVLIRAVKERSQQQSAKKASL